MKDLLKKSVTFLLGGKNFVIFKSLKSIYFSILIYQKIFPLIRSRKFMFLNKILYSTFFITFNPVKSEEKKIFNNNYSFRFNDWFSDNFNVWKKFLSHIPNFKYLEIGTFEGRSALFVSQFNFKKIVCVDPYIDYNETEQYNFKMSDVLESVKKKFDKINSKDIKLIREKSDFFFSINKDKFDIIYIDGYHKHDYVKRDFINSMTCLKEGGILICDDFLWIKYEKLEQNPLGAILECYETYKDDLKILFINHQIIFQKKSN
tara:strand:+ start:617 stop:1399 length:783 start_codon:yes stop_codon:yes gene_type:complete